MIAEILGPTGRVHYRRPVDDPLVEDAKKRPGYSVRFVEQETVDPPHDYEDDDGPDEDGYDAGEECGRWDNGRLGRYCTKAGSEECDFECPYSR